MISNLTPSQRKHAFQALGQFLLHPDQQLSALINSAQYSNAWFTSELTLKAVNAMGIMLNETDLEQWFIQIEDRQSGTPKSIGLVLAGNIPLVGFHDILCVLATGNKAVIKLSSQDQKLTPFLLKKLSEIEPGFAGMFEFTERLSAFDAVIATGSNNTSRYFEYYFGKVPHIIRKNRNSIAVLSGNETPEQFQALGNDIFDYFGLGCRNVAKIFVPEGYIFNSFFEGIEGFKPVGDHHKYNNNYDYNKSIYLVNGDKHLDNGFLLLKEDARIASPLAVLYYEEYKNIKSLQENLSGIADSIQCAVTNIPLNIPVQQVNFGESQKPKLWDYADGVNTISFLTSLN
ncbi:MAG: acyl-CoA reductase [Sphingobacteriaceae bacterium]|jgi:hypothetical protein|nr:acyl-CoA reductase [Sphingobacteriaceae bacterium]